MKVVLIGVCKNIEKTVPLVRHGFETLAKQLDCRAIFYENNSTDQTPQMLKEWMKQDSRVVCLCENYTNEELLKMCHARTWDNLPCRMEIIAMARNKVMDYLERTEYQDVDYVIVIDMDSPMLLPVDRIVYTLNKYHNTFDALICRGGTNGEFYDVYAFRSEDYPLGPEYMGEPFWDAKRHFWVKRSTMGATSLVPVYSAFNGLAILRKEAISGIRYSGVPTKALNDFYLGYSKTYPQTVTTHDEGRLQGVYLYGKDGVWYRNNSGYNYPVVCEHVPFFLEMRNSNYSRIYMCPELVWDF
jgi:hypothetical protein